MFVNRRVLAAIGLAAVAVATSTTIFLSPAQAASTTGTASVVKSESAVRYVAGKGASNSLVITVSGRTVTLDDRVAIKAGAGCVAVKGDKTKVRCTTPKAPYLVVDLGDKNDSLTNKSSVHLIADGGAGNDTLRGGNGADNLWGGAGNDVLYGGKGADTLGGDAGADRLYGQTGNDYLDAGAGNDYVSAGTGNDNVSGGSGQDRIYGEDGLDKIYGGDDNDYINGGSRADRIYGGRGADRIEGAAGDDIIVGDASATSASGTPWRLSNDIINGGSGNDVIIGGAGDDRIDGAAGDDVVYPEYFKAGSTYVPIGRAAAVDKVVGGSQDKQDFVLTLAGTSYSGFEKVWKAGDPNPRFTNTVLGKLNSLF